ncbi:MAG: hypothetical protein IIX70_03970 [Oscillospiraceae bacterium]|nr:hypothetical protein [Oscillospiraceae bacterium]
MKSLKKILAFVLSMVLVAGISVSGTLAYLQEADADVNVMTTGSVHIKQNEYERVMENGEYKTDTIDGQTSYVLKDFTQGKPLLPATELDANGNPYNHGAGDWDDTTVKMSQVNSYGGMQVFTSKNAVDKFVVVENTGKSDAYIRTLVAIEIGSTDGSLFGTSYHGTWSKNEIGAITIDGNNYILFEYTYKGGKLSDGSWRHENGILPAGDTAYPSLSQVYLNAKATNEDVEKIDGNKNGTIDILAFSQAVQADGFADAATALKAAFGTEHPWADGVKIPVTVSSADEMKAAIEAGEKDIVVKGAEFTEGMPVRSDVNVAFVDCTLTGNSQWKYANNASFTNCTFDCGSANAAIHFDQLYGELVVNNCTFQSGKIQIGKGNDKATATFNNCTFAATTQTHSIWTEMGIRVYVPTEFNNCEFNNRVVMAGSNGQPITFDSCTMNGGTPVYYVDNTDGIIRGGNVPVVTIK